jgi:hypothetical protein
MVRMLSASLIFATHSIQSQAKSQVRSKARSKSSIITIYTRLAAVDSVALAGHAIVISLAGERMGSDLHAGAAL